jgi:hypothetical protein
MKIGAFTGSAIPCSKIPRFTTWTLIDLKRDFSPGEDLAHNFMDFAVPLKSIKDTPMISAFTNV